MNEENIKFQLSDQVRLACNDPDEILYLIDAYSKTPDDELWQAIREAFHEASVMSTKTDAEILSEIKEACRMGDWVDD